MNKLINLVLGFLTVVMLAWCTQPDRNNSELAADDPYEESAVEETVEMPAVEIEAESMTQQPAYDEMTEDERRQLSTLQEQGRGISEEMNQIRDKYPEMRAQLSADPEGDYEIATGRYSTYVQGIDDETDHNRYRGLMADRYENRRKQRDMFNRNPDELAQPINGYMALYEHLEGNLTYPEIAVEQNIGGSVLVEFDLDDHGEVHNVRVTEGIDQAKDEEIAAAFNQAAMEAVKSTSGLWNPAVKNNRKVASTVEIPVNFDKPQ